MQSALFHMADAYRTLGPRRTLLLVPPWLVRRRFLVLACELADSVSFGSPALALEPSPLTPADVPLLRSLNPVLSELEIRRRLAAGHRCLLLRLNGALVYYRWDTTQLADLPYLGRSFRPLAGDLFTLEAFTQPSQRGRGIHSFATELVLQEARELGLRRSITMAAWWNRPALRVALEKTGRSIVGTVGWWGIGSCRRYWANGAVHLEGNEVVVRTASAPRLTYVVGLDTLG